MKEGITANESNIPVFSKDWNQREQLATISLQLDRIVNKITEFGENVNQGLCELERRLSHVEQQMKMLDALLK